MKYDLQIRNWFNLKMKGSIIDDSHHKIDERRINRNSKQKNDKYENMLINEFNRNF